MRYVLPLSFILGLACPAPSKAQEAPRTWGQVRPETEESYLSYPSLWRQVVNDSNTSCYEFRGMPTTPRYCYNFNADGRLYSYSTTYFGKTFREVLQELVGRSQEWGSPERYRVDYNVDVDDIETAFALAERWVEVYFPVADGTELVMSIPAGSAATDSRGETRYLERYESVRYRPRY